MCHIVLRAGRTGKDDAGNQQSRQPDKQDNLPLDQKAGMGADLTRGDGDNHEQRDEDEQNEDRWSGAETSHSAAPRAASKKATTRVTYSVPVFLKAWAWRAFGTIQVVTCSPGTDVAAVFNA
jgi:hypothetical protein